MAQQAPITSLAYALDNPKRICVLLSEEGWTIKRGQVDLYVAETHEEAMAYAQLAAIEDSIRENDIISEFFFSMRTVATFAKGGHSIEAEMIKSAKRLWKKVNEFANQNSAAAWDRGYAARHREQAALTSNRHALNPYEVLR